MPSQPLKSAGGAFAVGEVERPNLYLAEIDGEAERQLIETWLATNAEHGEPTRLITFDRPRDAPVSETLVRALAELDGLGDAANLRPLRVIWRATAAYRERSPNWLDLLLKRNPREPREREKQKLAVSAPDRWRVVVAEPARLGDLRARWRVAAEVEANDDPTGFARFVARQAALSLDHSEYRIRGARYKLPRIFKEDVADSARFTRGVQQLAVDLDRDPEAVRREALECLDELRTAHDPFVLDVAAKWFHSMYAKGYGEVDVDPAQIEMLRATFARYPVILLPSHKTNLDSPVVESVLALHNLPPPTLFAGINMAFWPMGPLMRRAGRVFLRRKIGDNPVYKLVLREWLCYLIEKRFNLEWFPEGTRSRTGKLLPPKLGLLSYAAEAYRHGSVEDLVLVPIAIIYDQSVEVSGFAREALGEKKKAENLAFMVKGMREMKQPQGKVYLRIGTPLSMREALGQPDPGTDSDNEDERLALQKLALAVAWETNQVTPITGIAIVTFALLAAGQRAVTMERIWPYVRLLVRQARDRAQPLTRSAEIESQAQVEEVLAELVRTGVVRRHDELLEPVYSIAEGQHLAAAFYRNSMLHFVLDRAIGEMALLMAAEAPKGEREAQFWDAALRLREALKFEFFFRERPAFELRLGEEMTRINPDWLALLEQGDDPLAVHRSVYRIGVAHAVLRPFIEAYNVVAHVLLRDGATAQFDRKEFLGKCHKLGRQMLLQRELRNPEAVSQHLFETGVQLVQNLKLVGPGPDQVEGREQFARRSRRMLELVDMAEDNPHREAARAG